ncbi:MAG: tRNA preQ1(34) S-adenosylmethionine ribosyltransferase-isomerase QueA [candidate division Zixibacteria bacterium]
MTQDINLYDYDLPEGMIALYPAEPRDSSRLMFLPKDAGDLRHRRFKDFPDYFRDGDLLVLNDSRVFPARLYGKKKGTGGKVEIFLLDKLDGDSWEALVRPGRRLPPGTEIEFCEHFSATLGERTESGGRIVDFHNNGDLMPLIWKHGEVPLPPYIAREPEEDDKARYQTIYAENTGAVAAPTAGFHFTDTIFKQLKQKGVETTRLTLHPGLGTFRPITKTDISQHRMHPEKYSISEDSAYRINKAKSEKRRVIAVGTTSARALESSCDSGGMVVSAMERSTDLFINPPYEYKVVDGLLTNFHLPKSTLLLLVSALARRERVLAAYNEAIKEGYRFYSYGDAMLIL